MLKKTITYTDFNDEEVTEDFHFNLTKAEVIEWELSTEDGIAETIQKIVKTKDGKQIIEIFKGLILKAYGVKSKDGRKFVKSEESRNDFVSTEAYSDLFIELSTDATAAAAFVNAIIPKME